MDLFLVETGLQMLNALEARHRFDSPEANLILLVSPAHPRSFFESLACPGNWNSLRYFRIRGAPPPPAGYRASAVDEYVGMTRQTARRFRFDRLARSVGPVDRLFLGNYMHDYARHFASLVPHRELVCLDDGTDTLRINEARNGAAATASAGTAPVRGPWGRFKGSIRRRFIDWVDWRAESLTFFTTYDLAVRPGDRVIHNDYSALKHLAVAADANEDVYFLGQPLVEDGYVTREHYLDMLVGVRRWFGSRKVLYIPHKRESEQNVAAVHQQAGLDICRFGGPIEYEMLVHGHRPRALASFFCSALETASELLGNSIEVIAFQIEPTELLCAHQAVRTIYDYFRSRPGSPIEVVSLTR